MRALPLRVVREESRGMQGVADLTERINAALQGMRKLARYKELNFKLRVQQGIQKELGQFSVEVTAKPCSCGEILIEARDTILPAFTALHRPMTGAYCHQGRWEIDFIHRVCSLGHITLLCSYR